MKLVPPRTVGGIDPCTDLGNATAFAEDHEGVVRFVRALGGWHIFDGSRWVPDDTGKVMRLARTTVERLFREAANSEDRAFARWAARTAIKNRLDAMLSIAESETALVAKADNFDRNPWVLNTLSGLIDLKTGECNAHEPTAFITKVAPAFYRESACPTWRTFLDRIMGGDQSLIEFLQRAVGYSLTGDTSEQVLFVLHGNGANGKSTFLEVLRSVLGDYAMQTPTQTLLAGQRGIPNDLARLRGARLVTAVETEDGRPLSESLVKQMTGGDIITARFLHREFFEFRPAFKVWLATNHKPPIRGTDHAIWRRIKLVPFAVTIPQEERDLQLKDRLLAESAGILRWAVEGCLAWQRDGLNIPAAVVDATESYRQEMDVLADFLADRCVVGPSLRVPFGALYEAYSDWARRQGEGAHLISSKKFSLRLQERSFKPGRTGIRRFFEGLGLAATPSEEGV